MILVDANILVSAAVGDYVRRVLMEAGERGVALGVPEPQLTEAMRVLIEKFHFTKSDAEEALGFFSDLVVPVESELYAAKETDARARLHERGQSDWAVLAAALAVGGGIWSHDRDFFGVGVPVWSSRNMRYAA